MSFIGGDFRPFGFVSIYDVVTVITDFVITVSFMITECIMPFNDSFRKLIVLHGLLTVEAR